MWEERQLEWVEEQRTAGVLLLHLQILSTCKTVPCGQGQGRGGGGASFPWWNALAFLRRTGVRAARSLGLWGQGVFSEHGMKFPEGIAPHSSPALS